MKSRVINRTPEQQAYVDSIVPPRKRYYKKSKEYDPAKVMTEKEKCLYYIGNCNFWINEYVEGRCDESKLKAALNSLYTLYISLRKTLQNHP